MELVTTAAPGDWCAGRRDKEAVHGYVTTTAINYMRNRSLPSVTHFPEATIIPHSRDMTLPLPQPDPAPQGHAGTLLRAFRLHSMRSS
ncbi:hypothetical protein E2C01_087309 [Portunus trituberculatus]|uniref:Uncharacterized protein n=1 Tax=Portunus trituberculatus TaxID=210409 RepID=A0A5B7J7T0_PORTR|nr:hypothetical protein [Portunus trituberculatus]